MWIAVKRGFILQWKFLKPQHFMNTAILVWWMIRRKKKIACTFSRVSTHLVTETHFLKQIQSAGKTKHAKMRRLWENSNITLYIVQCLLLVRTYALFLLFPVCQKTWCAEDGTLCIMTKKTLITLVIIQNRGLSETCVHELDEKADSCLIWPEWVSCKSVPHWTPKKDMLFYLSAQQCDLHMAQASTAETGTFNK